jgi:hypothetical protein
MTTKRHRDVIKNQSMPKALLIVYATIDPAVEKEWNEWYDKEHLPEILACPQFERGARYLSDDGGSRKYLTVYHLSSEDAVTTPEFLRARGWAKFAARVQSSTRVYKLTGRGAHDR